MHIRELLSLTRMSERQVRYLISEGFIPAPRGGRANADYGDDHIIAINRYNRLRELGFPPAAIKVLLQSKEGAPFVVAPGITLVVDPQLLGSAVPIEPILETIHKLLNSILKEQAHDDVSDTQIDR